MINVILYFTEIQILKCIKLTYSIKLLIKAVIWLSVSYLKIYKYFFNISKLFSNPIWEMR